jgi:hypothetical protein
MKRFVVVVMTAVLALMVSSCGGDSATDPSSDKAADKVQVDSVTFTTGELSVDVPEGWSVRGANESMDGYVDESERLDLIYLVKSTDAEPDAFSNPGIQVTHYGADTVMVPVTESTYDNTADLDPITLDNYTWTGFTGESMGAPLVMLFANPDKGDEDQFQVAVWLEMGDGPAITLADDDVRAILSSIQPG